MAGPAQRGSSTPYQLPRIADRVSFVYLERCTVHRDANAITAQDADGITHIPSATIGTLLLGPGTRITHQAMAVLGDCGANVAWVGEHGARFYAAARSLNRSSALVEAQATLWANRRTRLDIARAMYRMRFPDEDPSGFMRQQLLGMEGRRLKDCYRQQSQRTGVPWHGRQYTPGNFNAGDAINQAITAAAQCMYGVAHTIITALGCSPGLGFIHSGHELSFVMDIADLYKTEIGIPVAFDTAAEDSTDIGPRTRRALREQIRTTRLLERCVDDVKALLTTPNNEPGSSDATDTGFFDQVQLQSDRETEVEGGRNYADELGTTW
ncbi:CRISPR-associated protein Cas1 [Catenulispora acidiphila DSM 44928]|uniref:CRISPR-associated endonuclease Cas1 n=1 Tax=Catenulispora acidiphila (strain DSM 44928 / JCM 14897 / NBRC 102108 / NRRL B-24433 / ID139908) TaxID=479433 RepID=C7QEM2_CATAD|nr:type I-E CRISPR-associated endonuclease Cas1e [Catenulispora acidiphila]ACU72792.1 CRISPR-associated protein Cas1 [Catenulispora acidiphila DSM 44928]